MLAKPFTLLGRSVLVGVQAALTAAVERWAGQWGIAAAAVSVMAERAYEFAPLAGSAAPVWSGSRGKDGRLVWLAWPAELHSEMQRVLFASDNKYAPHNAGLAQVAPAAARVATDALRAEIESVCLGTGTVLPGDGVGVGAAMARGAGAVVVTLRLGRHACRVLLNEQCVQAISPAAKATPASLAPVNHRQLLATLPVTLTLTAGTASVKLGQLMSIGIGDVIRLDTPVDAPLTVALDAGAALFAGYLGKTGENVCIEITARN